jgi:hypothetical protein
VHATNAIQPPYKETVMSLGTILLIVLILLLIGAIPSWSHSRSWGYMPSGWLHRADRGDRACPGDDRAPLTGPA